MSKDRIQWERNSKTILIAWRKKRVANQTTLKNMKETW